MTQRYFLSLALLSGLLAGLNLPAAAQKDTTRLNQEVEVVKAYRPSVSSATRINLLPEINDTVRFRPDFNYGTGSHPISGGFQVSALKATTQVQREIVYPGYGKISGGVGNYLTPFVDVYLNNPNMQNGTLGLQLNHLSSDGTIDLKGGSSADAPFSRSRGAIFGSWVLEGVTVSSEFAYQRDKNRFYGYPVEIPSGISTDDFTRFYNTDQVSQLGSFDIGVKNNAAATSSFLFDAGLNLGYFSNSTDQVEKATAFRGDFSYNFGGFTGKLATGFEHFETENITDEPDFSVFTTSKSSWLKIVPTVLYRNENISLEGGINVVSVFDATDGTSVKPFPMADFSMRFAENFNLYAKLDGNYQNNIYSRIAEENRYVNPYLEVAPTNNTYNLSGGIKGKIASPFSFNLGLKYSESDNQYFYVTRVQNTSGNPAPALTDLTYNNAFEVVYDNLGTIDFSGDLAYSTPAVTFLLSGHFFTYNLATLEKAPYRPDFTLNAVSGFKVTEKVSAQAEFFLTGPRSVMLKYYLPPISSATPPPPVFLGTDPMVEVNLGAKYQLSKQLGLFGRIENLLNRKDEPWYGYTVQGIRFKVGASFSF